MINFERLFSLLWQNREEEKEKQNRKWKKNI